VVNLHCRLDAPVRPAALAQRVHGKLCFPRLTPGWGGIQAAIGIVLPSAVVFPLLLYAVTLAPAGAAVDKGRASRVAAWAFWSVWRMKLPDHLL
jgi:hypothetical protein